MFHHHIQKLQNVLYDEPIVSRKKIIEKTGIKFTTLVGVINAFQEKQILIETTGYSRNQDFAFQKYIDLFLKQKFKRQNLYYEKIKKSVP